MTTIEIIVLVVGVFLFAGVLGFALSQGGKEEAEVETFPEYTKEEAANIKAAEEAYNKPIVVEDIKVNEPEFVPIKDEAPVTVELQVEPVKPKPKKKYPRKKKPKVQE